MCSFLAISLSRGFAIPPQSAPSPLDMILYFCCHPGHGGQSWSWPSLLREFGQGRGLPSASGSCLSTTALREPLGFGGKHSLLSGPDQLGPLRLLHKELSGFWFPVGQIRSTEVVTPTYTRIKKLENLFFKSLRNYIYRESPNNCRYGQRDTGNCSLSGQKPRSRNIHGTSTWVGKPSL